MRRSLRARKIKIKDNLICYHDGQQLRPKLEGMKGQVDEWWAAEKVIQDTEEKAKEQSAQEEGHSPPRHSHPFRLLDDQKDTYLMLCAETPNAIDNDDASIASELESISPNSLRLPYIDAEARTREQLLSVVEHETPKTRTYQIPRYKRDPAERRRGIRDHEK